MEADFPGLVGAMVAFVLELAVDEDLDGVVEAGDVGGVPRAGGVFAGVVFLGEALHGTFVGGGEIGAVHHEEIAGAAGSELAFDAFGPHFVFAGFVEEDAGVAGFFGPAPFDVELVVGIVGFGAEVAGGDAGAVDDAVLDGPDGGDVHGLVGEEEFPAGEVFSVKEGDFFGGFTQ